MRGFELYINMENVHLVDTKAGMRKSPFIQILCVMAAQFAVTVVLGLILIAKPDLFRGNWDSAFMMIAQVVVPVSGYYYILNATFPGGGLFRAIGKGAVALLFTVAFGLLITVLFSLVSRLWA